MPTNMYKDLYVYALYIVNSKHFVHIHDWIKNQISFNSFGLRDTRMTKIPVVRHIIHNYFVL